MAVQPLQLDTVTHRDFAHRAWKNWLILATLLVFSTLAILTVTLPTTPQDHSQFWPWKHTDVTLRLALFVMVVLPVLRLSQQTRELLRLRTQNLELEREVQRHGRAEELLLFKNEALEESVAKRTAALEEQARALQLANEQLEQKNVRLLELNNAAHQFVDNVSHEFRTPLTVIKEYTNTLRTELADELAPGTRDFFDVIENRIDDLRVMVNDLLDISRLEADIMRMSRRATHPEEIVQRVQVTLERKAARSNVHFVAVLASDLPFVYCDPEKIGRVLINLGVNAMKFAQSGGNVKLWVRVDGDSADVRFGMSDDGPGIPPEQLDAVFERFSQVPHAARSSTKGFGLGLSIAKELVALNLGELKVKSPAGGGSVFWFSIPRAEPTRVLQRYLERLRAFSRPSTEVSLVRIEVRDGTKRGTTDLRWFLENQLRRSDILFEAVASGWALLAATHRTGAIELIERLAIEHARANRTRPLQPIPDFHAQLEGTWCSEAQHRELERSFGTLLRTQGRSAVRA